MHRFTSFVAGLVCMLVAGMHESNAQNLRPLQVGDTWRYRQTSEERGAPAASISTPDFSFLFQNKAGDLVFAMKRHDTNNAAWQLLGPVSPSTCMFDVIAHAGIIKTCDMSLEPGATWSADETTSAATTQDRFTVGATEDIVVPAGKYRSVRIQQDRTVTEVAYPGVPEPAGGYTRHFRTTYWYSPDVKSMAKVVREFLDPGSKIARLTEELESYSQHRPK